MFSVSACVFVSVIVCECPFCVCSTPAVPDQSHPQCLGQTMSSRLHQLNNTDPSLEIGNGITGEISRNPKKKKGVKKKNQRKRNELSWWFTSEFSHCVCAVSSNACAVSVNHPSLRHLYVIVSLKHQLLSFSLLLSIPCLFFQHPPTLLFLSLSVPVLVKIHLDIHTFSKSNNNCGH